MNGKQEQQGFITESLLPALDNLDIYEISVYFSIDLKMLLILCAIMFSSKNIGLHRQDNLEVLQIPHNHRLCKTLATDN